MLKPWLRYALALAVKFLAIIKAIWQGLSHIQIQFSSPISLEIAMRRFLMVAALISIAASAEGANIVVDFDDLPPGPHDIGDTFGYTGTGSGKYWNGSDNSGSFTSHGVTFPNAYDDTFGPYWEGFAYSNTSDTTTAGYTNQYSASPGTGVGPGTDNYGIAFTNLFVLPSVQFTIPTGLQIKSMQVTNTTYGALALKNGEEGAKKFGGPSGDDPDWFKLTVTGLNLANAPIGTVDFFLADFTFANNAQDYIVNTWANLDLTSLSSASKLVFSMTSSDVGGFGMNTPAYFALDNIELTEAAPEPATWGLLALGMASIGTVAAVRHARPKPGERPV
ncbi:MAG: DUF4465 domain-containing protein [Planctomycetes bacterium]|nr:DUF4465 domain-containing protein [Planctomycetota bacterium]